jgi:membrane-associated protease RseP (regulator of RpoE activity)
MELVIFVIILFLLGIFSYVIVKRSVGNITTTPVWLLWLVLMSPPLITVALRLVTGKEQSIPVPVLFSIFFVCFIVYLWLIEIGKPSSQNRDNNQNQPNPNSPPSSPISLDKINPDLAPPPLRPISGDEEKNLRDCFPWSVFYLQKIDYIPQGIVCLGKLKTIPDQAYKTIKNNIEREFKDRFLVIFQETLQGQPFFALVPNPYAKSNQQKKEIEEEPLTKPGVALALLFLTILTTTIIGAEISGVTTNQLESQPLLLLQGLPYSLGLVAILGVHELSHYLFAVYYRIKTTLPYFIPIPFFLGTFGAFISIKSPMPDRKAIFDVAIAGPLGGFLVTVPVLIWGLNFSDVVAMPEKINMLNFQALDPRFSCLLAILSKLALGSQLVSGKAIALHPLAVAGYIGLIVTALNLMPVGQLDGGHIVHAMFGQGNAVIIGQVTRLLVFALAMIRGEFIIWAIIVFFMPLVDQPALNDVSELDNRRDFFGLFCLALLVIILLPLPPTLAQWLNI